MTSATIAAGGPAPAAATSKRSSGFKTFGRWFNKSIVQTGRLTILLSMVLLVGLRQADPNWMQFLRAKVFDTYQQIKPRAVPEDSPVTIVDIDEKSIDALGQWPWPRTTIAALVDRLTEMNAKVIAFDVVFSEHDRTSLKAIADTATTIDPKIRDLLRATRDNDDVLAESIKRSGRVVLGQQIPDSPETYAEERPTTSFVVMTAKSAAEAAPDGKSDTPKAAPSPPPNPDKNLEKHEWVQRNILAIDEVAAGHGVFSVAQNFVDGIVRDVPMVLIIGNTRYPSLSMEVLRVSKGAKTINIRANQYGRIVDLTMRQRNSRDPYIVKTDEGARIKVYFAPHEQYKKRYVSFVDIINGTVDPAMIADKLVLIGTSAQGLRDIRATPLNPVLPGVEVHANILENVIFDTGLEYPENASGFEIMAFIVAGLIILIVSPMVSARVGALTFLVISAALLWWSWNAFDQHRQLYDPAFPIFTTFIFYSFLTYASFIREELQRKQIRGAFSQYLSPAVVEQLAKDPGQLKLGGENREMTFMFSDIRGFTSISELFDAEGLTKFINRLLTPLTDVILSHNGTIDKYMGDCVMAFWNAPLPVPNHRMDACRAGLHMVTALAELNAKVKEEAEREKREHRPVAIGIGINSGIACVGNMGSEQRFDYSVLGDSVNLASRLEGQSKTYHSTIVIGEGTAKEAGALAVLELDLIKVKGKSEAVRIFTLLGDETVAASPQFQALKAKHDAMLTAYRSQNWDAAQADAEACKPLCKALGGLATDFDEFYDMYLERIADYRANPPGPNWDAVYVATSK